MLYDSEAAEHLRRHPEDSPTFRDSSGWRVTNPAELSRRLEVHIRWLDGQRIEEGENCTPSD